MRFSLKPFRKKGHVQRAFAHEPEPPKYANPYFPKVTPNKKQQATRWFKKDGWVWAIVLVAVLGGGGFFLFRHSFFQITDIEVEGNQRISTPVIVGIVNEELSKKGLGIIPLDSYWSVQTKKIDSHIRQQTQQTIPIEQLNVQKVFPHSLVIHIKERIPAMNWVSGGVWYVLDPHGVIAQQLDSPEQRDQSLPSIIDLNNTPIQEQQHVVNASYVDFVLELQNTFTSATGIGLDHFEIPVITCEQKQFVAAHEIEKEISAVEDESMKQQIRAVQEKFQAGEIDIDQSLQLIEDIRNTTPQDQKDIQAQKDAHIAFKAEYVAAGCDLKAVLKDVAIRTNGDHGGFLVYVDSSLNLQTQLTNLQQVIREKVTNPKAISYIDVRYTDRAYIK